MGVAIRGARVIVGARPIPRRATTVPGGLQVKGRGKSLCSSEFMKKAAGVFSGGLVGIWSGWSGEGRPVRSAAQGQYNIRPQVSQLMTLPRFTELVKIDGTLVKHPVQVPSITGTMARPIRWWIRR